MNKKVSDTFDLTIGHRSVTIRNPTTLRPRTFRVSDGKKAPPRWLGLEVYLMACDGGNWVEQIIEQEH